MEVDVDAEVAGGVVVLLLEVVVELVGVRCECGQRSAASLAPPQPARVRPPAPASM
ncbi:hypothetical protein AB4851_13580 [Burkholderia sp. 22PA0099]|uniref:hypothetical protein n=1 Tax=Burkholderia sp. 22PA0099 TaxID=3237372 RepID=UPI0039C01D83